MIYVIYFIGIAICWPLAAKELHRMLGSTHNDEQWAREDKMFAVIISLPFCVVWPLMIPGLLIARRL